MTSLPRTRSCQLPRTPSIRTSQNPQNANFAKTEFSEVGCHSARETRALLARSPATALEKPRGAPSYQPGEGERRLRSRQDAQVFPQGYGIFVERERGQHTEERNTHAQRYH